VVNALKLGGSASNNGVRFMSDNYTANFVMRKDGTYTISHEKRAIQDGKVRNIINKIPLVRGIFALFSAAPVLIIAIIPMLLIDFFPMHVLDFLPGGDGSNYILFAANIVSLAVLIFIVKRVFLKAGSTWKYHGAEHKTIYAFHAGMELTVENVRKCPRVARRCGTNLVVFVMLFFAIFHVISYFFYVISSIRFFVAYSLAFELFDIENGDKILILKPFFKIGSWFQQYLFTREPTDEQIIASIATVNKLIELEEST